MRAMPFVRCPSPDDAATAWEQVARARTTAAFLVFGAEQPDTGASWCPDCVVADPVLRAGIARQRPELTVYECPVASRADWKGNADHPYRRHPGLRIARIPSLVLVVDGVERGRLVEADCARPEAVAAFLAR